MTVESEMLGILMKYGIRHLSAFLEEDEIKVRIYGNSSFDQRAYYRKNKEKIRKYQHEYYLKKRQNRGQLTESVTFKPNEDNNKMTESLIDSIKPVQERIFGKCDDFSFSCSSETNVPPDAVLEPVSKEDQDFSFFQPIHCSNEAAPLVTYNQLASAMAYLYSKNRTKLKAEDLRDTAVLVMQLFGFEKEVVGNHLEQDEIALMYQLEDIGLVNTRIEEYTLMDGTPWRVNYFILNSEKIREFSSKTVMVNQDNASLVYEDLPAEAWAK